MSGLDLFFLVTALTGFLVVFILLNANRSSSISRGLLGGMIFCLAFLLLLLTLINTGWILGYPWLFRLSSPTTYLIAPLSFLYVQSMVSRRTRLRPIDGLHALPFLLHAIELLPFFLLGMEEKQDYLVQIIADPELNAQVNEGILPPYWHQLTKAGLAAIYLFFQWKLIIPLYTDVNKVKAVDKTLRDWLSIETGLLCLLTVLTFSGGIVHHLGLDTQTYATSIIGALFFVLLMLLFLRPEVLYGIETLPSKVEKRSMEYEKGKEVLPQLRDQLEKIETYFKLEKPYLRQGFSLPEMARELDMSRHQLSSCINQGYQMNFNELINRKRIQFAKEELSPALWLDLSIEGIASEVGFTSRYTFSKVFKQITGQSPTEYRRELIDVPS